MLEHWFAAQLKPNGFALAKSNLERQGFTTFMPVRRTTVRHARQSKEVLRPLSPGYLFVEFDPGTTRWTVINSTSGVSRLIAFESFTPTEVQRGFIDALRQRCDAQGLLLTPDRLEPGQKVEILSGPFAKFVAEVENMSGPERVRVLLDFMGRNVRTELSRSELERR